MNINDSLGAQYRRSKGEIETQHRNRNKKKKPTDSPALKCQSARYPAAWNGRVPLTVEIKEIKAISGYPLIKPELKPDPLSLWPAYVNTHGEVRAIMGAGRRLFSLLPSEFKVIEWHADLGSN